MKKQLLCLVVILALTLAMTAYAAPLRDQQPMQITVDGGLQAMVDLCMSAAVYRDVLSLPEADMPPQALVEGVMLVGIYTMTLPYEGEDLWENRATVSVEELSEYYAMIFTNGQYALPTASGCECITVDGTSLKFDMSSMDEMQNISAYIYASEFDGSVAVLKADLYSHYGFFNYHAADIPENELTWLANATITMKYDPISPYGYTLMGYEIGETYLDGCITDWQYIENAQQEYSATIPSIFVEQPGSGETLSFATADKAAGLTIQTLDNTAHLSLEAFAAQYKDKGVCTVDELFYCVSVVGDGQYTLIVAPQGADTAYQVQLTFPAGRQAEFVLYAELIRNSFVLWSMSNG